jgi:hypothetical protein
MYDLKLSQRLILIKISRAISRVSWLNITDISGTISVPIIRAVLMMGTDMGPETSVIFKQLSRLIARKDFINVDYSVGRQILCFYFIIIMNVIQA